MTQALLQEKRIADIARRSVAFALREILSDPDAGLLLRGSATRRLQKSMRSKRTGKVREFAHARKAHRS